MAPGKPVALVTEPYLVPGVGQPRRGPSWIRWDLVSPVLVMLGIMVHAILEGLAIGLSVSRRPHVSKHTCCSSSHAAGPSVISLAICRSETLQVECFLSAFVPTPSSTAARLRCFQRTCTNATPPGAAQRTYGDVVTAFVAMATHKWVESVAISARFVKVSRLGTCCSCIHHLLPCCLQ